MNSITKRSAVARRWRCFRERPYYNGGRYWDGYVKAFDKYRLPVLFTSFLMGEVAATTLFHEMGKHASIPVYREVFRRISKDESRHARMALYLAKRTFPTLPQEENEPPCGVAGGRAIRRSWDLVRSREGGGVPEVGITGAEVSIDDGIEAIVPVF